MRRDLLESVAGSDQPAGSAPAEQMPGKMRMQGEEKVDILLGIGPESPLVIWITVSRQPKCTCRSRGRQAKYLSARVSDRDERLQCRHWAQLGRGDQCVHQVWGSVNGLRFNPSRFAQSKFHSRLIYGIQARVTLMEVWQLRAATFRCWISYLVRQGSRISGSCT